MPQKKEDMFYGLLTVKLVNPPATEDKQYQAIKRLLGLEEPLIDDELGVVPQDLPPSQPKEQNEEYFIVGVESNALWKKVDEGHLCINALGYTGGNPPLHLKEENKKTISNNRSRRRKPSNRGPSI